MQLDFSCYLVSSRIENLLILSSQSVRFAVINLNFLNRSKPRGYADPSRSRKTFFVFFFSLARSLGSLLLSRLSFIHSSMNIQNQLASIFHVSFRLEDSASAEVFELLI
jgi:hypothetical protein